MDKSRTLGKLWRLTKVLYFLFTIPLVLFSSGALLILQEFRRGGIWISDYYIGTLYAILFIVGYILLTDFIRRIISYINDEVFSGFIPYNKVLKEYVIFIIITSLILSGILLFLSQNLRDKCTNDNEGYNDYGECSCDSGFIRKGGVCEITLEQSILNTIPRGSFLREYKEIPNEKDTYLGIYITNYEILEEGENELDYNGEKMPLYSDCPGSVEGQGIAGDYYLFIFKEGRLVHEKQVPIGFRINSVSNRIEGPKLVFSYYNTRYNNSYYFLRNEADYNDKNNFTVEKTSLINFEDYTGDGINNEFFLVDHWDQSCGHNNYMIAGYDTESAQVIIYPIKGKDGLKTYWGDNFIPDKKGEVVNGWNCGDHGNEVLNKTYYKFNNETNAFDYVRNESRNCTPDDYIDN